MSIIKITNGRLFRDTHLSSGTLYVDTETGTFVSPDTLDASQPTSTIDLTNKIVAPGFIDLQINGAYGFDFSEAPADGDMASFQKRLEETNRKLVCTGTTSYLPTMTSQLKERYHQNLPYLGPSGSARRASAGAESLGAHCEGPFFAHDRIGVHEPDAIVASGHTSEPDRVFATYGKDVLFGTAAPSSTIPPSHVRMVTLAPERPGALDTIRQLTARGIVASVGHTAATYEQTLAAISAGAIMITHLFNQMNPHHHRAPGPLGVVAAADDETIRSPSLVGAARDRRPYFGIIADGNHVHGASVRMAYATHPAGLVLVTDALLLLGKEDGTYEWEQRRLTKKGVQVVLEGTEVIAGSCVTLLHCVNNFLRWTGASIADAIRTVTSTPARVLGLQRTKGTLQCGADADFVVLSERARNGSDAPVLVVEEVWKFGVKVFERGCL